MSARAECCQRGFHTGAVETFPSGLLGEFSKPGRAN